MFVFGRYIKSILSLALVFTLLVTIFAFPVSAALPEGDDIHPQYEVALCPECNRSLRVTSSSTSRDAIEGRCELGGAMVHTHEYVTTVKKIVCPSCGEFVMDETVLKYCQGIRIQYNPNING